MKFVLTVPFLALLFAPFAEAGSNYPVSSTQIQCDGPYPMTTLLDMIELAVQEAQKDLFSKCVLVSRPGHIPSRLTGRQSLEHFSVEGEAVTCVKVTVTEGCSVN
jgi:hypothetical protein